MSADPGEILEIRRLEVDGVPVLHLPMPGRTIVGLSFRVGQADEPPLLGGMTHLVEHLVVSRVGAGSPDANGTTEPFRETFTRQGSSRDCARFLQEVCEALAEPPLERLDDEAHVLRTEAAERGFSVVERLVALRFGYGALGAVGMPELFLRKRDPLVLRDWIEQHFVRPNAVLWIAGDLPADVRVELPSGVPTALPVARQLDGLGTPAWVTEEGPAVVASFLIERSAAMGTAFGILDQRLRHALRVKRGLAYDVSGGNLRLDANTALVYIWASCLPESAPVVRQTLLDVFDELSTGIASRRGSLSRTSFRPILAHYQLTVRFSRAATHSRPSRAPRRPASSWSWHSPPWRPSSSSVSGPSADLT